MTRVLAAATPILGVVVMIAGEIAWLYSCFSEGQWFWLAVGFTIPPVGPIYGLIWLVAKLMA